MKKVFNVMLVVCVIMSVAAHSQGIKLEYKFEKGKIYRYRDSLDAKSTQEMMGQEVKTEMRGMNVVRLIVDAVNPDGSLALIASTDSSVMTIKAPGMDTTQTPKGVIGKKFGMKLARNGKVSDFTAIDASADEGTETVRSQLGHYPRLSENPVSVGSTWNAASIDTVEQKQFGGKIITDTKEDYKITGKETKNGHDCFAISVAGSFTITGKGLMMGMELHFEGTGKTDGMIFFDPAQGVIVASESNLEMDMTVATTGQSQMVIPTTQTMKSVRALIQ